MEKTVFGERFVAINGWRKTGFTRWLFEAGMNYGDPDFWWPAVRQKRPLGHEGIDFFCYEDRSGGRRQLGEAMVPAPCDGRVVGICRDFLGHSLCIVNDDLADGRSLFICGHVVPLVHTGQAVGRTEAVGMIAPGRGLIPGHLHVSALRGDWHDLPSELSWPALHGQKRLCFVDPFLGHLE